MDAVTELGRNPVSKHQYGAVSRAGEKKKNDTNVYSCIDKVYREKQKKNQDKW